MTAEQVCDWISNKDWRLAIGHCRDAAAVLERSAELVAGLTQNLTEGEIDVGEASKAAESQVLAIRQFVCRASGIPVEFREWSAEDWISATASGHPNFYPRDVLRNLWGDESKGRRDLLKKADRALKSKTSGSAWAKSEPIPMLLNACVQTWCVALDGMPPMCLLTDAALAGIFIQAGDVPESAAISKAICRAGLYRPRGLAFRIYSRGAITGEDRRKFRFVKTRRN